MKRLSILFSILLLFSISQGQEIVDIFEESILLENQAFEVAPGYGKVLRGEGYVPDVDFEIMKTLYRPFISDSTDNPFYFVAYGFTFHYLKDSDSASYYFNKASEVAGINFALHLRLYQLYSSHVIKYAMADELTQFEHLKYKIGAISIPEIALYLNTIALEKYGEKKIDESAEFFILANRIDPYNPEIPENLLSLVVKERKFMYVGYAIKMFKYQLLESFNKFIFIYNSIKFARYFTLIIYFALAIMFFIKYIDKYFYVFRRYIRFNLTSVQKNIIGLVFMFIPLILQMNPVLWIFYISFIAFQFMERKEKILLSFFMIVIFALPSVYRIESHFIGSLNPDDNISVIVKADNSYWDTKLMSKINFLIEEQPFNSSLFFAKAKLFKKGGYFEKAEEEYNKILLKKDEFPELYNNLGNIMYLKGYYSKAIEFYEKSISMSKVIAQPYYNLGQVYLKKMQLTESDGYVRQATEIDYDLISSFIENADETYYNTEIIDCNIPENIIWDEFLKKKKVTDSPVMMGLNINLMSSISFIILILSIITSSIYKLKSRVGRCHTCGTPISDGDRRRYNEEYICEKDYSILEETLSDVLKARKFESFIRMRKKQFFKMRRMASLFFPGFSKILEGRQSKGFILIFLTSFLFTMVFSGVLFISKNPNLEIGITFDYKIIFLSLIVLFYLISFIITKEEK